MYNNAWWHLFSRKSPTKDIALQNSPVEAEAVTYKISFFCIAVLISPAAPVLLVHNVLQTSGSPVQKHQKYIKYQQFLHLLSFFIYFFFWTVQWHQTSSIGRACRINSKGVKYKSNPWHRDQHSGLFSPSTLIT